MKVRLREAQSMWGMGQGGGGGVYSEGVTVTRRGD